LLSKRKNKQQGMNHFGLLYNYCFNYIWVAERRKEAQKAALDIDEIFGQDDGKTLSSSSSSSSSSRDSSPESRDHSPTPDVPKQEVMQT
jgi:hypothetical protein